jgi:hypothetical protein
LQLGAAICQSLLSLYTLLNQVYFCCLYTVILIFRNQLQRIPLFAGFFFGQPDLENVGFGRVEGSLAGFGGFWEKI